MPRAYEVGMPVDVRGERWTLVRAQPFAACTVLTLEGRERANAVTQLRVIDPFDRPRIVSPPPLRRRPRRAVLRAALGAITSARRHAGLWTAADARLELWPYQLEPALAVIRGATRLLLADAVGLGKTIQAGLVLSELRERGWVERALIVCPAGLRETWSAELRTRFSIDAAIADQPFIAERVASLPPGVTPWSQHAVTIASIDFIKRPDVLAALQEVPFDLVIADEAHHLAPGTDRGAAVSALAGRAPWVVLVSATPHSGDVAAFSYLTSLGGYGDRLAIFRRQRRDAGVASRRHTHVLAVAPAADERALFDEVHRYVRSIWRGRGAEDHAARLVAITLARRCASSAAALTRTLSRRLELLRGAPAGPSQVSLPWDESDPADDEAPDTILQAPGLADARQECAVIESLLRSLRQCGGSAKMARLCRTIARVNEPVIVFTEYRDTLEAVVDRLPPDRRAVFIHGGMPIEMRHAAVAAFNAGAANVLVATDTAGEGLNLHHRCRLVIDVDLPWNPVRLEQRIGRVDRIGQRRTVHAIRLCHRGTIEDRVLDLLRLRQARADTALAHLATEMQVAKAVFDDAPPACPTVPEVRSDAMAGAAIEAAAAQARRRALSGGAGDATRCWCVRRAATSMVVLLRVRNINRHGTLLDERLVAQRLQLARALPDRRQWRRFIGRLADDTAAPPASGEADAFTHRALIGRVRSIRARLAAQLAVEYQRSLFDQRADDLNAHRRAVTGRLDAALARVAGIVTAPADPEATRVEFIAAWSDPRR